MSQENVELARRAYQAWNQDDLPWLLDHITDDFVIRPLSRYIDLEEVYAGKDGFVRFARDWSDAWEQIAVEVERIEDLGERLVALITHHGTGRTSGVAVTEEVGHLVMLREGKFGDLTVMEGWRNTLEAAGLRE